MRDQKTAKQRAEPFIPAKDTVQSTEAVKESQPANLAKKMCVPRLEQEAQKVQITHHNQ